MGDVLQVGIDGHYSILLSHGPTKVNYPGLTPGSGHIAEIVIASARTLRKCSRWCTKFGRLVFHCSGSAVAA